MNCKRDQLAWIKVPAMYNGSGLEKLNNHVVRTRELRPGTPVPTWYITPKVRVVWQCYVTDASGVVHAPGHYAETDSIPDAFLRPFDPASDPAALDGRREVSLEGMA